MTSSANTWVWFAVVLLIALMRFVSRILQVGLPRNLQIEDFVMLLTVILYILLTVFLILVAHHGTNEIPMDQVDSVDPATIPDRIVGSKMVIVVEQMWLGAIWGCKACLLLLYSTMTKGLSQHKWVKGISIFCAISFVVIEILFFGGWCHPFSAYWSVPPKSVQCSVYRNHLTLTLALNIATDLMIMAIPLPLLIKAKLNLTKKLTLLGVFSLGAFVILCSILSKYYSLSQPYGDEWVDWYVREAATAVIVANLPQTWTLFRRMFNLKGFLHHSSYDRSRSRSRKSRFTSRLDSSTIHLSRFRNGDKSQLRSTIDRTESGERITETPLEIWEHRQFHVTNEAESTRRSPSLSDTSSAASIEFEGGNLQGPQVKTTVTTTTTPI
ncbi:uncharacterized protein BO97DRAFT_284037 [Aspergillus homomorphus CBS 101889]|uniref:Rhodopsin domain-containing protein n=1 Tax=Aspergillus homomorphus (strain CBS 101889) TaxID=1450537 RepID=A0A395I337_ASPHC|nr:hypothetical protein BO97DRAFT_284037 [Aspergillus homomorphus CBS 101889]RAL14367.1 hypothetical protein BO97DRAFT_284037 [Aspergillus homomorphus CBS 101889]